MAQEKGINTTTIVGIHYETNEPVTLEIRDGVIVSIVPSENINTEYSPFIICPGLIDNQVNGYANVDFSGDDLTVEGVLKATIELRKTGVTTYLPTLITNSPENLLRNSSTLKSALAIEEVGLSVPGFHLEGPYLSKEDGFRGCHPEQFLCDPNLDQFKKFQASAGGKIIQLTLAPELKGAQRLIRYCTNTNVLTAIGHSNADAACIRNAHLNGTILSTHLGNGCANFIHRHTNPLWPQLAIDGLIPTLIADGFHLLPDELTVFLKVKGADHILLTSDITFLAGMPAGRYRFGGANVLLTEDGLLKSADQDCLAGASLPLLKGVENMVKFTGCTLGEAINMATKNVARVFGWSDRGELAVGKRADLLLLKSESGKLSVEKCFIGGKVVYEADLYG